MNFYAVMSFVFACFGLLSFKCLHEFLGAALCLWVKLGILGVLELRNTAVCVVVLSME
jgi:hypothetical protein